MAGDDIFCKIIAGQIPSERVYEDDECIVINDINGQAPVHMLVVPKQCFPRVDSPECEKALLGHLLYVAGKVAKEKCDANGYRVVINNGKDGGQEVEHLHIHVLGQRQMKWPPG